MEDRALKNYFKFDETDLFANRNGDFSEGQKKNMSSSQTGAIREKRIAFAIGLPLSIAMIGGMIYLIYQNRAGADINTTYAFMLGLCGFPLFIAVLYIFRLSFIRQKYVLKKVEGPVNIIKEGRRSSDGHHYSVYELHIGGETFHTTSELSDVMMQGDTYIIYYSIGTISEFKEIRSVELISKAK